MTKYLLFLFTALALTEAHSVTLSVVGEKGDVRFQQKMKTALPITVGEATVEIFENFDVPFEGSVYGISEIYRIAGRMDQISDSEMKAYGWCFAIDGVVPETLTNDTLITESNSNIEWFYAFAHYKDGKWIGQCVRDSASQILNSKDFEFRG